MGPATLTGDEVALGRHWHPLALAAEVGTEPVPVRLLGRRLVLARLGPDLLLADDRCPHRHAPLHRGRVVGGQLSCGYHGWCFDGTGACVAVPSQRAVPSRADLAPLPVAEAGGLVWGALEPPAGPPPCFPEADGSEVVALAPRATRVSAGRLVENFLDDSHFPYLHAATFGTDEAAPGEGAVQPAAGGGFRRVLRQPFLNREDPAVAAGRRDLVQERVLTYTWVPPFTAHLRIEWLEAGVVKALLFAARPTGTDGAVAYQVVARTDLGGDPAAREAARAFEDAVFDEDLALLEAFDDVALPLDLTAEVHVRADRPTVELRRRLSALLEVGP